MSKKLHWVHQFYSFCFQLDVKQFYSQWVLNTLTLTLEDNESF